MQRASNLLRGLTPFGFALLLIWIGLALLPMPPQIPITGLDASWAHALNVAHARNFIFGRDIVFTFGPLGYLLYPLPGTVPALAAFATGWIVHAFFLLGLLLIWRSLGSHLVVFVCWAALSVAMLLTDLPFERIQLVFLAFAIGIVASLAEKAAVRSAYLAIAGVAAGVTPLFRTNDGIAVCGVFYAILLTLFLATLKERRISRREGWTLALLPPVTFIAGFFTVEHTVSSLWDYVKYSAEIVLGYSEAMALAGPMYQAVLAVCSLATLWLVVPFLVKSRRDLLTGFLPAILAGFFAFKNGMVRQDTMHADLFQIKVAVSALFLLVCVKAARDRWLLTGYVLASFGLGAILYAQVFPMQWKIAMNRLALQNEPIRGTSWDGVARNLSSNRNFSIMWDQMYEWSLPALQTLRVSDEVSEMVKGGTVDDVPSELDIVTSNGWRWNPRPVIQSYSAYTPVLDQLNAAHLASGQSAEHILLQWEDIDGRQPLLDDAASWRSLFDHYDVALTRPEVLVLKRRDSPRYLDPHPAGSTSGTWDREIPVPTPDPEGFTMMRVEIDKSLYGSVRGLLYRNSATYLNATYTSGKQSRWRVTRPNLLDGALIATLPQTLNEVLPYFGEAEEGVQDHVASIRFESPGLREFSSSIRIAWYSVAVRPGATSSHSAPIEPVPATGALAHLLKGEIKGNIDSVNGRSLAVQPVQLTANRPISIFGWVVDAAAKKTASAAFIDVDGQVFPAAYGASRLDVSDALKEPGYEKCGFTGRIPATPGNHQVMIRVINAAGTGYYAGPSFVVNVK